MLERIRARGGQTAGKGNYWNFSTGARVILDNEGMLPGDESVTYYKAHPIVLLGIAPILGLLYAAFLPFIGMAMLGAVIAGKLFNGAFAGFLKGASFGWTPSEAYLSGKKKNKEEKK